MSGGSLIGLILLSMAWLFFAYGLALHYALLRKSLKRGDGEMHEGEPRPSSLGFVPGVVGSLSAFFTIPALAGIGIEVPWPWFWILLPLVVDPYCAPSLLLLLLRR